MRKLLLCCAAMVLVSGAAAQTDQDIHISVRYKTHAIRLRPKPVEGDGAGNIKIVLHANGTVDDVVEGEGKNAKKWELKKRSLGVHKAGVQYRVVDRNTIQKTFADGTFVYDVKVVVDGNTCKADVSYTLKPGEKEFVTYSPELGVKAYYSQLKPFDIDCKIE